MKGTIANNPRFQVLFENGDYVVIDKPAPLKVHPGSPDGAPTLYDELRGLLAYELVMGGQISIINRLDRETSGVTLVAKNAATARRFGMAMMERLFHKTYHAIVHGVPSWEETALDAPILRQGDVEPARIYVKQKVHPAGVPCSTGFKVIRRFSRKDAEFSLIECKPRTGRMHQIRVHLSHLGHPIVGDKIYGADESCYLDFIETSWTQALEERLLLKRHALHAARLELEGEGAWEAPMPEDMAAFLSGSDGAQTSAS